MGLQAFCDSKCRFLSIASKLCSSTNDNTCSVVTQLSEDIKNGKLHQDFNIVLDEAYPCSPQEMSPWTGKKLPQEKDAFNYYLSLQRQCIERAFGILVKRWGIFWRPLRMRFDRRINVIKACCRLHNICIEQNSHTCPETMTRGIGASYGFDNECDWREEDNQDPLFTDGTGVTRGYRSDQEYCPQRDNITTELRLHNGTWHRDRITRQVMLQRLKRPKHSRYSRA